MEKEADNLMHVESRCQFAISTRKENQQSCKQRINGVRARQAPQYLGGKGKTGTSP